MKTGLQVHKVALIVALTLAGVSAASAANWRGSQFRDPENDPSGMMALGIDITNAGNTSATVGAFIGDLSPQRRYHLTNGCRSLLAAPLFVNSRVLGFCQVLVEISPSAHVVPPPRSWGG